MTMRRLLANPILKHSLIYMSWTLAIGVFNYSFHFLVSRRLSVAQYGELQSLIALFTITAVFTSAVTYLVIKQAAPFALRKDYNASQSFYTWLWPRAGLFALSLFVLMSALAPFLRAYLHLTSFAGLLVISAAVSLSFFSGALSAFLAAWKKFGQVNAVTIISSIIKLTAGWIIVSYLPFNIPLTGAFLTGGVAGLLTAGGLTRRLHKQKSWNLTYINKLSTSVVSSTFVMSLGIALLTNLDVILVKNVSSPELAGLYGAFNVLAGIVLTINLAVVSVVLPFAAALAEEGNPVPSENILTAYIVIFAVNVLATFVYALWGREIIVILFGAKYAEPSGSLWLLGIVSGLLAFIILEANLAFARGEFKVIYALALTVLAMAITINSWHASIGQVALDLIISFIFGNVFVQIFQRSPSRAPVNI